jgi:hypothetical protein
MVGHGKEIPARLPRGRASKLIPEVVRQVHSVTTEGRYLGSRRLAQLIAQATEMSISSQTVNTIRKCLHFRYARARQCPLIIQLHQAKKVKFCHECLTRDIDWTHVIIISDESRFGLYDDSRSMWIQRGIYAGRTFYPMPKHDSSSIMAWGQSN